MVRLHVQLRLRQDVLDTLDGLRGDLSREEFFDLAVDAAVRQAAGTPHD